MLWLAYGIYLVVSFIVLLLLNWKSKPTAIIKLAIVACLPVVGWFMPILWIRKPRRNSEQEFANYVDSQQQEHKIRRIGVFHRIEKQRELDVVPIEDALVVSQHKDRRQVLIDVLKQDTIQYIEILQQAISNEDTETSHYAVSAIMELKRKLLISLQELEVRYEQEQHNPEVAKAYIEVLAIYLKSGFLDERTMRKYQYTYLSVLTHAYQQGEKEEWLFAAKLDIEIELGIYSDAEQTALQYVEHYPLSEQAYLSLLRVYFVIRSYQKLQQTLERLKSSPIRLTNQGLMMVRFWSRGVVDEEQYKI